MEGNVQQLVNEVNNSLREDSFLTKVGFILFVFIAFVVLLSVGTRIMTYIFGPSQNPLLLRGAKSASEPRIVRQDPNISNSIPILRSKNEDEGIEFTYSSWLFINSLGNNNGTLRHVFSKGDHNPTFDGNYSGVNKGLLLPDNGPGLYLGEDNDNSLVIAMNTFENKKNLPTDDTGAGVNLSVNNYDTVTETVRVSNIPLKKWIHVVIRVKGQIVDVYINGIIAKRHILTGIPKQNYGDFHMNKNGGFDGNVSSIRYFKSALSPAEISTITSKGPNMKLDSAMFIYPKYFSLQWYLNGASS